MSTNPFDDHIKSSFENYTPEVPPHIWNNIAAKKEKNRPFIFWWQRNGFTAAAILLAFLGGGYFYIQSGTYQPDISNKEKITKNIIPGKENIPIQNTRENSENSAAPDSKVSPASAGSLTSISSVTMADRSDGKKRNQQVVLNQQPAASSNVFNSSPSAANMEPGEYTDAGYLAANTFLGRLKFTTRQNPGLVYIQHEALPLPCPDIEKNVSGNKKYLEVYAGPDLNTSIITDAGNRSYAEARKASTKMQIGYSAGARFTKVFSNSMSIRTGLNLSQVNERFSYKVGDVVQVFYIINTHGDTTGTYSVKASKYSHSNNVYRTADIPLVMGYELGNEKLHLNLNAGAIINIYSWQNGQVLDSANNPVDISKASNSPYGFKSNVGVGFTAAASLYYKFSEQWHVFAESYVRYNLNQANKTGITLKQKFNTTGLRIGLRMDLR
ncbi:MAG: hypothetical protein ABIT96_01010 [Ferruginibacter sp.]